MDQLLTGLERWYAGCCDGDWEHQRGIRISTLDNPGWAVDIDLEDTSLSDLHFEPVKEKRADHDWVHCWVAENVFKGRGGPQNLRDILACFLTWKARSPNNIDHYE